MKLEIDVGLDFLKELEASAIKRKLIETLRMDIFQIEDQAADIILAAAAEKLDRLRNSGKKS